MKKYSLLIILIAIIGIWGCVPRIDMDMEQWGDHAYIDNVQIIKLETNDSTELWEYYNNETYVTGVRAITISNGTAVIDSVNATATVTLKSGEALDFAAFKIYHKSMKVEPIENSPKAGIINDLTAKEFHYRLFSADGTERDWIIKIE